MRSLLALAAACGFTAVALGAFGAHALALAIAALVVPRVSSSAPMIAGWAFFVGIVLFSGSLYAMSLSGVRALGAVTPFGGLAFLVGWAALLWAALKT